MIQNDTELFRSIRYDSTGLLVISIKKITAESQCYVTSTVKTHLNSVKQAVLRFLTTIQSVLKILTTVKIITTTVVESLLGHNSDT